jgi:hypothetical protein
MKLGMSHIVHIPHMLVISHMMMVDVVIYKHPFRELISSLLLNPSKQICLLEVV